MKQNPIGYKAKDKENYKEGDIPFGHTFILA